MTAVMGSIAGPVLLLAVTLVPGATFVWAQPAQGTPAAPSTAMLERGNEVYTYWCATCHSAGRGMPGTAALQIKYRGTSTPAVLEERTDLTPQSVAFYVRNGVASMPFFRKTEISDADLAALAAYLTRPRDPSAR
jgi:(+)-pinoresinol hydroxylase